MASEVRWEVLERDSCIDWVLFYERTKGINPHLSEPQVREFCRRLFNERAGKAPCSAVM